MFNNNMFQDDDCKKIYVCSYCGEEIGKKAIYCSACTTQAKRKEIYDANVEIFKEKSNLLLSWK